MKNIAIIPARSGSKGLKNKNIKMLNGKPLLAYSIVAAIESKCFDTIIVSTDSKKYATIATKYGAEVPFIRSKLTSCDTASSWDVVKEVLDEYHIRGKQFDTFTLLQPTSPLRNSNDIKVCFKMYKEKKANSIISVCEADSSIITYELSNDFNISKSLRRKKMNTRRQDIKKVYKNNGAIYLANVKHFLKTNNIYDNKCYAYVMNKRNSIDIDDITDFKIAEALLK